MADVLLFHHAQGLTEGVRAFAAELRTAGHRVSVPDLFDGRTFPTVEAGVAHAQRIGFGSILEAGVDAAGGLPNEIVYAGFSLGVLPAQRLAQQRPGARGALLYHGVVPFTEFGDDWPAGVPLQAHVMRDDPWEDADELEDLVRQAGGELFLYDGAGHLFTDSSSADFAPAAADLVMTRTLEFLASLA